jgi:hypothetical protein
MRGFFPFNSPNSLRVRMTNKKRKGDAEASPFLDEA